MYILKESDNSGTIEYGPFGTLKAALKGRTQAIRSAYKQGHGFRRESYIDDDSGLPVAVFRHSVFSTVIYRIARTN